MESKIYARAVDISRNYIIGGRNIEAIKNASCEIMSCDRIAIMGPSGSGKSTLLHILGGMDIPSKGNVEWPLLGNYKSLRPKEIGIVFQMPSLIASLNVIENIKLPILLMDGEDENATKIGMELLDFMELNEIAYKLPNELSGGQLQRASIARVLATRPRLILADEPTGQLDHPTAKYLLDVILKYIFGSNTALVIATHDDAVANRMDKTWRMTHGKLEVGV
jgi:ABC-type lipoprotein export system ATPase subunit